MNRANNKILLNYISIFGSRLSDGIDISNKEFSDFLSSLSIFITDVDSFFETVSEEKNRSGKSTKSRVENPMVDQILARITILKNMILKRMGEPEDTISAVSPNLITVEEIEKDIVEKRNITDWQIEKLNEIYANEKKIFKLNEVLEKE